MHSTISFMNVNVTAVQIGGGLQLHEMALYLKP